MVFKSLSSLLGVGLAKQIKLPKQIPAQKYLLPITKVVTAGTIGVLIGTQAVPLLRKAGLPEALVTIGAVLASIGLGGGAGGLTYLITSGKLPTSGLNMMLPFNLGQRTEGYA